MSDSRREFEDNYHIKNMILLCGAKYRGTTKNYIIESTGLLDKEVCSFINGAWYAFQHQQKKINAAIKEIKRLHSATGLNCLEKIKELLK